MRLRPDEAFEFIVSYLASGKRAGLNYGCDLHIPTAATEHYQRSSDRPVTVDENFPAFYDAAAELCRRGVLRLGRRLPSGIGGADIEDKYSLTQHGENWLKTASDRAVIEIGRMADVFLAFGCFGDGFDQRAQEAVASYRGGQYLAACAMAGAAAESILLACATAKLGEQETLRQYLRNSGRSNLIKKLADPSTGRLHAQFSNAMDVISYWRDDAAHGQFSPTSEIQAWAALVQLLRLAQLAKREWKRLTTPPDAHSA
jgi:hypothetical protein